VLRAGDDDLARHEARLDAVARACNCPPVWRRGG
jgi:hypothetical protein